jgi:hypothetical protein
LDEKCKNGENITFWKLLGKKVKWNIGKDRRMFTGSDGSHGDAKLDKKCKKQKMLAPTKDCRATGRRGRGMINFYVKIVVAVI